MKGLIIDIDSFSEELLIEWQPFVNDYRCVFLTTQKDTEKEINDIFGNQTVILVKPFQMLFAPSIVSQRLCVQLLELSATEIAYVSKNIDFINNAMEFLSGTIWITKSIQYEDASRSADLIVRDLETLYDDLKKGIKGFIGETTLFPGEVHSGKFIPSIFKVDGRVYPLVFLGRYFGYEHYMSQLHPYSSAIYLNKRQGRKYYGIFDEYFSELFLSVTNRITKTTKINGICCVPSRMGGDSRFSEIIKRISNKTGLRNYHALLQCKYSYPSQKPLSQKEREENVRGVFQISRNLNGESLILIDDIASTGSTLRECVRTLAKGGAGRIIIIVLAVNQIHETYWSSFPAQVNCPRCGDKMHLLVNSNNKRFFYTCYNCRKTTLSFEEGREKIIYCVNKEMNTSDAEVNL